MVLPSGGAVASALVQRPGRRDHGVCISALAVSGSTPAPGAEFLRYSGQTSCVAIAHDGAAPVLLLDAGTGLRRVTTLLGSGRSAARSCSLTCTRITCTACPSSGPATGTTPGSRAAARAGRRRQRGAGAGPGHVPAAFPDHAAGLRGSWTFGALRPGRSRPRGSPWRRPRSRTRRPDVRVPGQRRPFGTHLHPRPAARRCTARPARVASITRRSRAWRPGGPADPRRVHAAGGGPSRGGLRPRGRDYAVALGRRAGARRVLLAHHQPERTDAELDQLGRRLAGANPDVRVAAEGQTFDL